MFFDKFQELCDRKGVSCKRAAMDMGLAHSIPTKWKKTGATPNGDTLKILSEYFSVSVEELLGTVTLSADQQKRIFEIMNKAASSKGETLGFAIARSGVKKDFFPRLSNSSLSVANSYDILDVAKYLGVEVEIAHILNEGEDVKRSNVSDAIDELLKAVADMDMAELQLLKRNIEKIKAARMDG